MGKFDGILICTDLDGTILKNDKTISNRNIEAMEYFKKEGGYFTFVTGRMPFFVSYEKIKFMPVQFFRHCRFVTLKIISFIFSEPGR